MAQSDLGEHWLGGRIYEESTPWRPLPPEVFNQLALTEDRVWTDEHGVDPRFTDLFLAAAGRALPGVSDEKVQRRAAIAMVSAVNYLEMLRVARLQSMWWSLSADGRGASGSRAG